MLTRFGQLILALAVTLSWSEVGLGHAPLDYSTMKPRANTANSKTNLQGADGDSCGSGGSETPGAVQHTIKAGDTFQVKFVETIDHPAKYLIDLLSLDTAADPLSTANPAQVILHN